MDENATAAAARILGDPNAIHEFRRVAAENGRIIDVDERVLEEDWLKIALAHGRMLEIQEMLVGFHNAKNDGVKFCDDILSLMHHVEVRAKGLREAISGLTAEVLRTLGREDVASIIRGDSALGLDFVGRTIEYHTQEQVMEIIAKMGARENG